MSVANTEKKNVFVKKNVSFHEYNMHKFVYHLNIVNIPKIISYNSRLRRMTMEKIDGMSLADYYGEELKHVPKSTLAELRNIIKKLQENNITYPDITGYNFITNDKEKIWIIDFEHSHFDFEKTNRYVNRFINGTISRWNPDFE